MNDLLDIPDFLKRKPPTKKERAARTTERERRRAEHPGKYIRMSDVRVNPRHALRAAQARVIPSRSKEGNRNLPKVPKPTYPTTEALKAAVVGLDNGAKRKLFYKIALENGINPMKWNHVNNGQVAMNLGNTLRGRYYKNQIILINGRIVD